MPEGKLVINLETGMITLAVPPASSGTSTLLDTETEPTLRANITVYDSEF